MNLLTAVLLASSNSDKTSIIGRFFSFKALFILAVLFVVVFLFVSPPILQAIAPGYSAIDKYSDVKRCSLIRDSLREIESVQASTDYNLYPASCEVAKEGGVLYCNYSDAKGYFAPEESAPDQRYVCPLLVNANGIPNVPRIGVSAGTQQATISSGIVLMLAIIYFTFTSTKVVNNIKPMA